MFNFGSSIITAWYPTGDDGGAIGDSIILPLIEIEGGIGTALIG